MIATPLAAALAVDFVDRHDDGWLGLVGSVIGNDKLVGKGPILSSRFDIL